LDKVRSHKVSGVELVNWVLSEMCGLDIHPVAVVTSKATLVLSLAQDLTKMRKAIILPIYMADAIPKFEVTREGPLLSIYTGAKEAILIPVETAKDPAKIDQILDSMVHFAKSDSPLKVISKGFTKRIEKLGEHRFHWAWASNLRVLRNYIAKGRDTIWAFIIKNQYRPLFLFQRSFDNVVGNPPWLAYKFVKEPLYQEQIRALTFEYGLLDKSDVRNFPHVDTSTLFFAYSADRYLEPGGRIGFVMPYSVITGSKVHANFKLMRFGDSKLSWDLIVDCKDVQPLFNVPTCVLICSKGQTDKEKKL
jgi:hypothetical protein